MAQISRLHSLVNGAVRGIDLATNTLVVGDIQIGGLSGTVLTKTILDRLVSLQDGSDVDATYHTHDGRYYTQTQVGSTSNALGASLIGIEDAASQYTSTNVEGALTEALDAAQAAQATADAAIPSAEKGANNGVATLDGAGKLPVSQLPTSVMEYQGAWNANTNSPTLADGTGDLGDTYRVSTAGSQNLGSGSITFFAGDFVIYNGSIWQRSPLADGVSSVFGRTGAVVSASGDYTATQVTNTPAGNISSTTVQAALNELDTEKVPTTTTVNGHALSANVTVTKSDVSLGSVDNVQQLPMSYLDTDGTLAANSDVKVASQKATKTYVDTAVAGISNELVSRATVAGESFSATTLYAVRWGRTGNSETAGRVYKADIDASTTDNFHVAGLIKTVGSLSAGGAMTIVKLGKLTATSHGFTVGEPIYLDASGALTNTAPSASSSAVVKVGIAADANTIDVQVQIMGIN